VLSTHFYTALTRGHATYEKDAVDRWSKQLRAHITTTSKILVPVNFEQDHWVLVSVDLEQKRLMYIDPYPTADRHNLVLHNVRRWLRDALEIEADAHPWEHLLDGPRHCPRQEDSCSCGVYLCAYALHLAYNREMLFEAADVPRFRRLIAHWIVTIGHVDAADPGPV
jgi:Ulp1 family protease